MQASAALPAFFHLIDLAVVDSTSDEAKRLARADAVEGTLICAQEQTAGHGRLGRSWISPPGNLYFSLLLRPQRPAYEAAQLTFVAAVATADAIAGLLPVQRPVTCKWPNDVLVGGRKIAGILLESQADRTGNVDSLVMGIGVNVASHPPPASLLYPATSLHAEGGTAQTPRSTLAAFCHAFLGGYDTWRRDGFAPVRAAWLARADKLHQAVRVGLDGETASGTFVGLDPSGAMVLEQGGRRRLILAGDVSPAAA